MVELPGAVVDSGDLERDSLHAIGEDDEVLVPGLNCDRDPGI